MTEEKEQKKEEKFQLVEVPTQLGLAIKSPSGETISTEQALVECLNYLSEIKKSVG